jgi:TATA-binding protein-associated factor Taf7
MSCTGLEDVEETEYEVAEEEVRGSEEEEKGSEEEEEGEDDDECIREDERGSSELMGPVLESVVDCTTKNAARSKNAF